MIKGARKILDECMNVKKGENVLIIIDTTMPLSIAETLAMACKEREGEPTIIIMSPVQIDGNDPPPPVAEAIVVDVEHRFEACYRGDLCDEGSSKCIRKCN